MASGASEILQSVSKTEKAQNASWLLNIVNDQVPVPRKLPRIQKVARILREVESNKGCFDPLVVSFGPCHHHADRLRPMESFKLAAARWFVLNSEAYTRGSISKTQEAVENVYHNFVGKAPSFSYLRDCYDDDIVKEYDEKNFMKMMFLDGCLILLLICHDMRDSGTLLLNVSSLDISLIVRDMFLLENQIPYEILKALMSLMPGMNEANGINKIKRFMETFMLPVDKPSSSSGRFTCITKLVKKFSNNFTDMNMSSSPNSPLLPTCGGSNSPREEEEQHKPIHLLDLLRLMLVGKDESPRKEEEESPDFFRLMLGKYESPPIAYFDYNCRSICKELKAAGIKLKRNKTNTLRDITFRKCGVRGYLYLPRLHVDDYTKSCLLNLVAYEMCFVSSSECVVTSYVCFLESLIDHAEDVKELRSKNILVHVLGSDEEVAKLFNEVGTHLFPDSKTYSNVMDQIREHSQNHVKVWIGEFVHTHFSSPWTVIAFLAALFVTILTLLQTIYSAGS